MRTKRQYTDKDSSNFDLSISDLMSALCGIFALIMICVIVQLNTTKAEYNSKNKKAEEYYSMQHDLYIDLINEFEHDLDEWNAEITDNLTIRFKDSNVLFEPWKAELRPAFRNILIDFFPRLIAILERPEYQEEIEEIRIEGHTARENGKSLDKDYEEGMELSQERTRAVMLYCLNRLGNDDRQWVQSNIAAIGYSLSRPVKKRNGEDDWDVSRRVEFRIKTKAEKVIEELADMRFKINHE